MSPKEYLMQVARAERELKTLRAKLRHYEDIGLTITRHSTDTPVRASRGSSRVENAAVGIVDVLSDIEGKIRAYTAIVS